MVVPYAVSYSQHVREAFVALVKSTSDSVLVKQILTAAKAIEYRLRIYPQFGQPLRDMSVKNASLWIGVETPLVVKYIIDEDRRQVLVGIPFQLLNRPSSRTDDNPND